MPAKVYLILRRLAKRGFEGRKTVMQPFLSILAEPFLLNLSYRITALNYLNASEHYAMVPVVWTASGEE